jgi:hypothetical protein
VSPDGTHGAPKNRSPSRSGLRGVTGWIAGTPGWVKRRLVALVPVPDPNFDPFKATEQNAPRVREIVLQIGPMPGAVHRRGLEGPSGIAWG